LIIPSKIKKLPFYKACVYRKSQKKVLQHLQEQVDKPSQKLYIDLARLITPIGISKVRWFLVVVDNYCC